MSCFFCFTHKLLIYHNSILFTCFACCSTLRLCCIVTFPFVCVAIAVHCCAWRQWCCGRWWWWWWSTEFSTLQYFINDCIVVSISSSWCDRRFGGMWCCGDVSWSWSSSNIRYVCCFSRCWFSCISDIIRLRWFRFLWLRCNWLATKTWTKLWSNLFEYNNSHYED